MDASSLRVATEADLERIAQFNDTARIFPDYATISELIEAETEKHSSATAVICEHDKAFGTPSFTYRQLNERANQLAHLLRSKGAQPDQVIAIMVERSFAMIIGLFGIIKAGAAYLPISPDNPPDRINYMLENAGVKVLLVQNKTTNRVNFEGVIINLEDPQIYAGSTKNPIVVNKPRDLIYVIYTSGSTGKPKGVMIEHRSVVNRLSWMQKAYPIDRSDVILQKTPFYFDVSVWELFWWALHGAKLCFLPPEGEGLPLLILETVRKHHVSVMHFVPSMLNVFLEYLEGKQTRVVEGMTSVRRLFASGEALAPSHVRKFNNVLGRATGARLANLYGPTEATVDVSYFDCPTHNDFEKIPIGRPIDNTRFHIIKNGKQVALGETGELCIAGVGLARGYLNNPSLTREKFVDNLANIAERVYRTGDNARWLSDGNVEFLGREDYQVKIRGLRIELGEIENSIREYPGITDCIAVVKTYSDNIILIIAYVVCKSELEVEGLKHYLRKYLPDYMIPNRFEKIDKIPLTPSGKANRKALPEPVL
jgi:D-alanine--poly(phosphoribitol) ligase subunit 1